MDPVSALTHLEVIALQVAATIQQSRKSRHIPAHQIVGERVPDFIRRLDSLPRHLRDRAIRGFVDRVSRYGRTLIEDSMAYFFYVGRARRVSVPGDFNDWNPTVDVMSRMHGTQFHYLAKNVPYGARVEYKLAVDTTWILDPYNHHQAVGGSGPNSEIAMPGYRMPNVIRPRVAVGHGTIEVLEVSSTLLKRSHPVFVYLPHGYGRSQRHYPSLYVLDGGDYLSLGMMATVLDNMIADGRIRPLVGVFVEPRTDVTRPGTTKRTTDYGLNELFVAHLTRELRPMLENRYSLSRSARNRGIMGASLGGLLATYAAYTCPHVFSFSGAQSPAYWWKQNAIIKMIAQGRVKPIRFYLDTGTIQNSLESTRAMREILKKRGYHCAYAEHPEGHNWGNWRTHIPNLLEYFWGLS
jgi:enterochelin esterase family protein